MPRFSIKDLMLAITLVAVGIAMVLISLKATPADFLGTLGSLIALYGGIAIIGAGMMAPLHKKARGATVGLVLGLPLLVLFLFSLF